MDLKKSLLLYMKYIGKYVRKLAETTISRKYTSLNLDNPARQSTPVYQLLDNKGVPLEKNIEASKGELEILKKVFYQMIDIETVDDILNKSQRQGRISFYMTSFGESGTIIGSAAGLSNDDMIFCQYREKAILLWRGFSLTDLANNCIGNIKDNTKSRQMPIHFSNKNFSFFSVSSPLATQLPHAAGYGYGLKMRNEQKIAVGFMGDGSASEGDFYAALNFASTLKSQTLFICRNNGYAISTPICEQTTGDGIISKAQAFDMKSIRVDGNDAFAVYRAVKHLREYILSEKKPAFLEAMTYRVGNHSTSDDSSFYRSQAEIDKWRLENNPMTRLKNFLTLQGVLEKDLEEQISERKNETRNKIMREMKLAEELELPSIESMFDDVYQDIPPHLVEQKEELLSHIKKYEAEYRNSYALDRFQKLNK